MELWNAKQSAAAKYKPPNAGATEFSRKMYVQVSPIPYVSADLEAIGLFRCGYVNGLLPSNVQY